MTKQVAFTMEQEPGEQSADLHRHVLTLLIEAHASYRQIQTCLKSLLGISLSLGQICHIVQQAGERVGAWLRHQRSSSPRALALDEQYSSKRGQAYLNVVDVHSGQVRASPPPVPVEGESWMVVLWDLQAQGVNYDRTVSDGGNAIHEALKELGQLSQHQRDVWHLFQFDLNHALLEILQLWTSGSKRNCNNYVGPCLIMISVFAASSGYF